MRPPRHRDSLYTAAAIEALRAIWEAAGYPWSRRLKALLPLWMPWARRRLRLRLTVERQVLAISPRQMDRRLAPHRRQLRKRLYGRTKPGTLLKHHFPLKTDRWVPTTLLGLPMTASPSDGDSFLSGGQKKMAAIARATRSNARSTARGGDQRHEGLLRPKTQNFAMPAHTKVVQKQCG